MDSYGIVNGYNTIIYNESTSLLPFIHDNLEIVGTKKEHYINIGSGFDCETTKYNDFAFPYVWQFSIGKNVFICRNNEFIYTFVYQLSEYIKKMYKKSKLVVWVANLSYEFSFYKDILKTLITKIFAKTKRHVLSFTCCDNIEFRECLGVFGTSLADIAKNYTTTQKLKGDLDYNLIRHYNTPLENAEIGYIVNDVAILSELTDVAFKMFLKQGKKLPFTQTGIVRNDVKSKLEFFERKSLEKKNLIYTRNKDMYMLLRKYLYSGGLTHSLSDAVGKIYNDITCFDLTSAYPWAFTQKFPSGMILKPENYKDIFKHKHWFAHIIIELITSKTGHSIISKHKCVSYVDIVEDNGRIYSASFLELWVNEIDFKNISLIYNVKGITCVDGYYFDKSEYCPDFIKNTMLDYYLQKQELKNKGLNDTLDYRISKSKVNSIYGMVCTKLYESKLSWDYDSCNIYDELIDWNKAQKTVFNYFIGYWCTSYVRNRLVECISKFPDDIIQYDTDSIYCKNNTDLFNFVDEINKRIENENNININDKYKLCRDLGLWDNDGFYTKFMPMGSKRYIGEHSESDIEKILNKKFYSKGKTPTENDILLAKYKITFAGAKDIDILTESKRINKNIYDYLKNFSIESEYSTKLCAMYFDDFHDAEITDYKGEKCYVSQTGGTILNYVTFNACIAEEYYTLNERYNEFLEKECKDHENEL